MQIKIQAPAKINLILEVLYKREDGFHEIQSIMQTVSLYDYLIIQVKNAGFSNKNEIELTGNSKLIPYNNDNLVYKAVELFFSKAKIRNKKINIHIEKNIPIAAGLAGGSADAAGTLSGLNILFDNILSNSQLHEIAFILGSDVNFCFEGGTQIASSRGEILSGISTPELNIVIIKPSGISVSAFEAYAKYDELPVKPKVKGIEEMEAAVYRSNYDKIPMLLNNHLEKVILCDYPETQKIKNYLLKKGCKNAVVSGSGPSVFGIYEKDIDLSDAKPTWNCFKTTTISDGVKPFDIQKASTF